MSVSSRSPQADLIDAIIWDNLGKFWTDAYYPEDKDALSCIYESMFTVLDAEYVRLFEINKAKSIQDCPVYSQRRWVRLDMNLYNQVKAFLQFLRTGAAGLLGGIPGQTLACADVPTLHSKHWHISFPWTIPDINQQLRGLINLQFPINSVALVDVYQITESSDGIQRGIRLMPRTAPDSIGWDFELMDDGCTIHIRNAPVNAKFEILAGFDFSEADYDGLRPIVFQVENMLGSNICQVPDSMSTGLPVHAMVVHNPPDIGTTGLEVTNREDFDTTRTFYPYTGDSTGVANGSQGKVVLPASYVFHIGDVIYLYGTEAGPFDTVHTHKRDSVALSQTDLLSGVLVDYIPSVQIPLGLFGSIDFIGQQLQIFINGRMIFPSEYSFEYASNKFTFRKPIAGSAVGVTNVDVLYMDEVRGSVNLSEPFHIHQQCYRGSIQLPKTLATFDDGGTFDDEDANPPATFDDYNYDNTVFIADLSLTTDQLEVFVDGLLLEPGVDYTVTPEVKQTRISFSVQINGKNILITIIKTSLIYVYGLDDIIPGNSVYGITTDTLRNILSDLQNTVSQFETVFGSKVSDLATLLEAAFIAAGGGNPLLALFFDEYREYDGLPLDALNMPLTSSEARAVESANTQLIDIPFLVDHVLNPSVRYDGAAQFLVVDGNIQSSIDLTAPRSDTDPNPGVWWCPLVLLDESMLAKNFGALVGDIRPASSVQYKNALAANLMLRFGGPTMQAISSTAAIMLGSDMFTQDSTVIGITPLTTAFNVTITATDDARQDVFILSPNAKLPQLGASVYSGQSIAFPVIVDLVLDQLYLWEPGLLTVNYDLGFVQIGDRTHLTVFDPLDSRARSIVVELNVTGVRTRPTLLGSQTVIQFDQKIKFIATTDSRLRVFRDYGDPRAGFDGVVTSITEVHDTIITTEYESFAIKPGQLVEFNVGDPVYRGMPVRPGLALAYDHASQPDWYLTTPEIWRQRLEFSIEDSTFGFSSDQVTEKYGSIDVPATASGFSLISLSDLTYIPKRGTFITLVQDITNTEYQFNVVGNDAVNRVILVTPPAIQSMSGVFQFSDSLEVRKLDYQKEYFEVAPVKVQSKTGVFGFPITSQAYPQRAGAAAIETVDISTFPLKGRVNVVLTNGGVIEFEYFNRSNNRFFNCHWVQPFTALVDSTGNLNSLIPIDSSLVLVAEYKDTLLNPAFSALAARRGSVKGVPLQVDFTTAAGVYDLLKANIAVLELRSVQEPAILEATLAEVTPGGTSLEIIHRDVLIDIVDFTKIADQEIDYDNIGVTIVAQNE